MNRLREFLSSTTPQMEDPFAFGSFRQRFFDKDFSTILLKMLLPYVVRPVMRIWYNEENANALAHFSHPPIRRSA
jgi:hypothetical protein